MAAGHSEQLAVDAAWVRQVRRELHDLKEILASAADDAVKVEEAMATLDALGFEIEP